MNRRCIIITGYNENKIKECVDIRKEDYIICVDRGYLLAQAEGIIPDLLVGDFDSFDIKNQQLNSKLQVEYSLPEKDDTDTMLAVKYGLNNGFNHFVMVGGIGGRLDHTMANFQSLTYIHDHLKNVQEKSYILTDGKNIVTMIEGSKITVKRKLGYKISLFSYTEICLDVNIHNVKYPLYDAVLKNNFPLGVSNEFLEEEAMVSNSEGKLMIIMSKD